MAAPPPPMSAFKVLTIIMVIIGFVCSVLLWYLILYYQRNTREVNSKYINDKSLIKNMALMNTIYFLTFGFMTAIEARSKTVPDNERHGYTVTYGLLAFVKSISYILSFTLSCIVSFNMTHLVYTYNPFDFERHKVAVWCCSALPFLIYLIISIVELVKYEQNQNSHFTTTQACYNILLFVMIAFNIVCYVVMYIKSKKTSSANMTPNQSSHGSNNNTNSSSSNSQTNTAYKGGGGGNQMPHSSSGNKSASDTELRIATLVKRQIWYPVFQVLGRILPAIIFFVDASHGEETLVRSDDQFMKESQSYQSLHTASIICNLFIPVGFIVTFYMTQPKALRFMKEMLQINTTLMHQESAKSKTYETDTKVSRSDNSNNFTTSTYSSNAIGSSISAGRPLHLNNSPNDVSMIGSSYNSNVNFAYPNFPTLRASSITQLDLDNTEDDDLYMYLNHHRNFDASYEDHYSALH